MLRTSIRAPIPFPAGVHKAGRVSTDFLTVFTNMDRKPILEPAQLAAPSLGALTLMRQRGLLRF